MQLHCSAEYTVKFAGQIDGQYSLFTIVHVVLEDSWRTLLGRMAASAQELPLVQQLLLLMSMPSSCVYRRQMSV